MPGVALNHPICAAHWVNDGKRIQATSGAVIAACVMWHPCDVAPTVEQSRLYRRALERRYWKMSFMVEWAMVRG